MKELKEHFFENPMADSHSAWEQHLPSASSDSSFEIFGEHCHSPTSTSPPSFLSHSDLGQRIAASGKSAGLGQVEFPPPITTIGSGGKPRVYFKSFRKDGRFVLKEIRIPTQRILQSKREDGRLTMRVLVPRDEEEEMEGGKDDK